MHEQRPPHESGLRPYYQTYQRQKCFIAYSEQAEWADDLLSACQEVLSQPEFNLEPDYARKHFHPNIPLRQKALELIANARYGIYDLSYWRDDKGEWQLPRNVFIELGMAIALNRPALLLRHANNRALELPQCLQSISGHMLEFSGETTLKKVLLERLPQWLNVPPEQYWWNRYCIFGNRVCEYREAHPRAKQWGEQILQCHISDSPDVDRPDFRGVVEDVLDRFSDVTYEYLDALPLTNGYSFLLCSHCQVVRSSPFAIYRITPQTPAETLIAIGMSLAMEMQFEYKVSKILLTENKLHIPSLLEGYEVIVACSDKERKHQLQQFLPMVTKKVRSEVWKPKLLPFFERKLSETVSPDDEMREQATLPRILIVDDYPEIVKSIKTILQSRYNVVTASGGIEAIKQAQLHPPDLILLDIVMSGMDGLETCRQLRIDPELADIPIIFLTALGHPEDRVAGFRAGADDYVTKPFNSEELQLRIRAVLRRTKTSYSHFKMEEKTTTGSILIVEADVEVAKSIEATLQRYYKTSIVPGGSQAIKEAQRHPPDLIISEVIMPEMDGLKFCRQLKLDSGLAHIPIMFLTALGHPEDRVAGLRAGADDYLTKPFNLDELRLRVRAILSRTTSSLVDRRQYLVQTLGETIDALRQPGMQPDSIISPETLPLSSSILLTTDSPEPVHVPPLYLDCQKRQVNVEDQPGDPIELTKGEMDVLVTFMNQPNRVFSCQELVQAAWGHSATSDEAQGIIRPYISRLRWKMETNPKIPRLIRTVRRQGYYLAVPPEM